MKLITMFVSVTDQCAKDEGQQVEGIRVSRTLEHTEERFGIRIADMSWASKVSYARQVWKT